MAALAVFFLALICCSLGKTANKYTSGDPVSLYVNKVGPLHNAQEFYEYYDMPYCPPSPGSAVVSSQLSESLGESLSGYELKGSRYEFKFMQTKPTTVLCSVNLNERNIQHFNHAIERQYMFEFFVDDLPIWGLVGLEVKSSENPRPERFLYTHHSLVFEYHEDRIIGAKLDEGSPINVNVEDLTALSVNFTYSVVWVRTQTHFQNRMEKYHDQAFFNSKQHWALVYNSVFFGLLLVAMIYFTVIQSTNSSSRQRIVGDNEFISGWRNIQGEVFRPPPFLLLFSCLIGIGAQIVILSLLFILISLFSVSSGPIYRRGTLNTLLIATYAFTSFLSGYVSGSYYKRHGGRDWKKCFVLTFALLPVVTFAIEESLNFVALTYASLAHIPFGAKFSVTVIWLFISVPLTLGGTLLGRNHGDAKTYGVITPFPNTIPPKRPFQGFASHLLLGGLMPFSVMMIEIRYVFASFFENKMYYTFDFLLVVFVLLLVITAGVSILSTFILLNNEDYRWQWTSFLSSAFASIYLFIYAFLYWNDSFMTGFLQNSFYFGYLTLFCFVISILLGSVGFFSSSWLVHRMYHVIHID